MATEVETAESRIGPPFLPFVTLQGTIHVFSEKGVPSLIDKRTFSTASGSMQVEIIRALKFLGLVDASGHPSEKLTAIAAAEAATGAMSEDYRAELRAILIAAYQPIMKLDLATITEHHLRDEFARAYGLSGESSKKAMTFFLKAAQKAGMTISPWIKLRDRSPSKTPRKTAPKKKTETPAPEEKNGRAGEGEPFRGSTRNVTDHQMILVEIMNTYDLPDDLEDALMRVVRAIKGAGV